jgi:hypothetical protein
MTDVTSHVPQGHRRNNKTRGIYLGLRAPGARIRTLQETERFTLTRTWFCWKVEVDGGEHSTLEEEKGNVRSSKTFRGGLVSNLFCVPRSCLPGCFWMGSLFYVRQWFIQFFFLGLKSTLPTPITATICFYHGILIGRILGVHYDRK